MSRLPHRSVLALAAVVCACHHAPPVVATSQPAAVQQNRPAPRTDDSAERAAAARRDSIARADSLRRLADAAKRADAARQALVSPVHFEFNQDAIISSERSLLDQKAAILSKNPALHVRIEGNADERGSEEYNLALGMRRATAVQEYLKTHGVAATQLDISSNGEERPVCQSHDEPCWGENRRDDVVIMAGGDHINPAP